MMTPDKKPFFAGTYFPKRTTHGHIGMMELLPQIYINWIENRDDLLKYSEEIMTVFNSREDMVSGEGLSKDILITAYKQLESNFDEQNGGFGSAPKFPVPHNMMFLLRYYHHTGQSKALTMVGKTLTAMRQGGIFDQLGYGFARYSTDNKWLVPHFEKMLYDNALLCIVYLEAYQCTGNMEFALTAQEILAYILRDMNDKEGGFYSAEDADSEGAEGKFYVFTRNEVINVLGEEQGNIFADFYNITEQGNFEHGTSILNYIGRDIEQFAKEANISTEELQQVLATGRQKLYAVREKRVHPYKDDKILTSWNALMIAAFAKAARVLKNTEYAKVAEKALEFIFAKLMREDGRLLARYREGETAHLAYLDDYAFLLMALVELYEATFVLNYLLQATKLAKDMQKLFWDNEQGGFYFYGIDAEKLLTRPKELYDGAIPSGNSVAALYLLKLADYISDTSMNHMAEKMLQLFSGEAEKYPTGYSFFLLAIDYYFTPKKNIVVVGRDDWPDTWAMLGTIDSYFLPELIVKFKDEGFDINNDVLKVSEYKSINGLATAYVCKDFTCQPPIQNKEDLMKAIEN